MQYSVIFPDKCKYWRGSDLEIKSQMGWMIVVLTPLSCNPGLPKSRLGFQYIFPNDCVIASAQKTGYLDRSDDETAELPSEIAFQWLSSMQNEDEIPILMLFERFTKSRINTVIKQSQTSEIPSRISVYFSQRLRYSRNKQTHVPDSGDSQNGCPWPGFSLSSVITDERQSYFFIILFKYYQSKQWRIDPYRKEFSLSPVFILHNSERRVTSFG